VKAELEAQQNLERIRMEKLVQSGALTSKRPKPKNNQTQQRNNTIAEHSNF
jgi:hypothetical protein